MTTDWSHFSLSYTCLIILALTMLLTANKDMSIVAKINAFGVIFVVIFLLYVIQSGFKALMTTEYTYN